MKTPNDASLATGQGPFSMQTDTYHVLGIFTVLDWTSSEGLGLVPYDVVRRKRWPKDGTRGLIALRINVSIENKPLIGFVSQKSQLCPGPNLATETLLVCMRAASSDRFRLFPFLPCK